MTQNKRQEPHKQIRQPPDWGAIRDKTKIDIIGIY